jgi:hypothetical protein
MTNEKMISVITESVKKEIQRLAFDANMAEMGMTNPAAVNANAHRKELREALKMLKSIQLPLKS